VIAPLARQRIQKAVAAAGVASRRAVEQMVLDGRVTVNGRPVVELPCFVDLSADDVRVDGRRVRPARGRRVYYLLNKPRGVVCTQRDPAGRPRAVDLVPTVERRVYCVGRLDVDTTGLILLTNDGELTQHLTHPSAQVPKCYVAEVDGRPDAEAVARLKAGAYPDGRRTRPAAVKVLQRSPKRSRLKITLCEGCHGEVWRVLARLGHRVRRLKRVAIGPVTERGLKVGHWRPLRASEVRQLRRAGPDADRDAQRPHGR
jgi:23S rRNA pseudouridine2605 synthase